MPWFLSFFGLQLNSNLMKVVDNKLQIYQSGFDEQVKDFSFTPYTPRRRNLAIVYCKIVSRGNRNKCEKNAPPALSRGRGRAV